jgi:hypothetical protein
MLIKPFPHGKGEGKKPVYYLVRQDYQGRKEHPPVVLRGDPEMTKALIDSIDREWKYTAGVCAWGPEDSIAPEKENELMDRFEAVAFAGMAPDQYNILWVRHSHAGHHELHFVIPRMELSTGKAFNAFPPGWERDFAPLRDLENIRNGWSRPDDPERARLFTPSNADITEARLTRWGRNPNKAEKEKAREAINAYIKARVENGTVRDRADVVTALREAGLDINREGKDYITVMDPESREKIRLKGGVYGSGWTLEKFGRAAAGEGRAGTDTDGERVQGAIADLEQQLAGIIAKRAAYNVGRYHGEYRDGDRELEPALPDLEPRLRASLDANRDHGLGGIGASGVGRAGVGDMDEVPSGELSQHTRPAGREDCGTGTNLGEPERADVGSDIQGNGARPLHHHAGGRVAQPDLQNGHAQSNQNGEIDHEQKRTGTHSLGLPGTNRNGSEGRTPEPGREDSEHREPGGRLRAAIDAAVRIVSEFATAYRRAERYLAERGKTVEREAEQKQQGMSR